MEKPDSEEEFVQAMERFSLWTSSKGMDFQRVHEEDAESIEGAKEAEVKTSDNKAPGPETVQSKQTMNLFDIPPEIFTHILGRLCLQDVFSFRLACKYMSAIGADHISVYRMKINPEIIIGTKDGYQYDKCINVHYKTISMTSLLQSQLNLPSSQFTLKFERSDDVFDEHGEAGNWDILKFVEQYGKQITHLKMSHMTLPFVNESSREAQFYEGFPNLETLEIEQIEVRKDYQNNLQLEQYFPSTFKHIRSLSINKVLLIYPPSLCKDRFWILLQHFNKLETLRIPQFLLDDEGDPDLDWGFKYYIVGMLRELTHHLTLTYIYLKNEKRLKCLDMENFKHIHMGDHMQIEQETFAEFLSLCATNALELQNVPMELITKLSMHHDEDQKTQLRQIVTSVIHAHPRSMPPDFENLEKVSFHSTGSSFPAGVPTPRHPPLWPKLTTIQVNVNRILRQAELCGTLFNLLFRECRRPLVTDLYMNYETIPDYKGPEVWFPSPQGIVAACPNLTKLSINNWPVINTVQLVILWNALPNLEDICLENLPGLSLQSFTGPRRRNQIPFLKLTNLQKLSLLGVHKMPNINDDVFQLVFSQLKIREFHLTSWEKNEIAKVKSITITGVESLLTGEFAKCIRKFPFDCWALEGTSQKEFGSLRDKFRYAHSL